MYSWPHAKVKVTAGDPNVKFGWFWTKLIDIFFSTMKLFIHEHNVNNKKKEKLWKLKKSLDDIQRSKSQPGEGHWWVREFGVENVQCRMARPIWLMQWKINLDPNDLDLECRVKVNRSQGHSKKAMRVVIFFIQ